MIDHEYIEALPEDEQALAYLAWEQDSVYGRLYCLGCGAYVRAERFPAHLSYCAGQE